LAFMLRCWLSFLCHFSFHVAFIWLSFRCYFGFHVAFIWVSFRCYCWRWVQAVLQLPRGLPDAVLIDGTHVPANLAALSCQAVVDGDAISLSIAAASILAKVRLLNLIS
jgi:hypothetical protein